MKDHLAGSVAALELLDRLGRLSSGTSQEQLFLSLRQEIEQDQHVVKLLIESLGEKESTIRRAAAWLTEKVGEAKLALDGGGNTGMQLLEGLEALGLGIQGKLGLWRVLSAIASDMPEVRKLDLAGLEQRARGQFDKVEAQRLLAAKAAFEA